MKHRELADRACPVSRAAAQLADAWTFVLPRELFLGNRRFEGLRLHTGMSPRSLALRLAQLVAQDVIVRVTSDAVLAESEYGLTEKACTCGGAGDAAQDPARVSGRPNATDTG